jgi:hypothetical protein
MYLVLTSWWALVGIGRMVALLLAWWHVPDLTKLERQAEAGQIGTNGYCRSEGSPGGPPLSTWSLVRRSRV